MANGDGAGRQRPTSTIGFLQCGHWGGGADFFSAGSTVSKAFWPGCQASRSDCVSKGLCFKRARTRLSLGREAG